MSTQHDNDQYSHVKRNSNKKTRNILIAVIVVLAVILLAVLIPLTLCSRQDVGDGSPPPETEDQPDKPNITDISWEWEKFTSGDDSEITVDDPTSYTLVLKTDGSVNIKADCNSVLGTYTMEDSSLRIVLGPTTLAFCGEDSLDNQYLPYLENVATYVLDGGKLYLNLQYDSGNMVFRNGGKG